MQALRASGHLQNSLVLFSSDHHSYDKRHCYTSGSKVPRRPCDDAPGRIPRTPQRAACGCKPHSTSALSTTHSPREHACGTTHTSLHP